MANVVNVIGPRDPLPGELQPGEPVPPNTIVYLGRDPGNPTAATFDSNYLDRDQDVTHNGTPFTDMKQNWTKTTEIDSPYTWGMLYPITVSSTKSAYYEVLDLAGARIFPYYFSDFTDERIVDNVHNRDGRHKSEVPKFE